MAAQKKQLDFENLRARLKVKNLAAQKRIAAHPAFKLISSGALAGSLLLSVPSALPVPSHLLAPVKESDYYANVNIELAASLREVLPAYVQPLTITQEEEISKRIKKVLGIDAVAILENNHLNQTYGNIGAEQHLPRYPGDTAAAHGEFVDRGITPGRGGWGYVTSPEVEKYYIAVQTLYLPDWKTNTKRLSGWYKFRRTVVINPVNGKAIVTAIADAGPSWWTGKHFGGSPEVMAYLKLNTGMQKGPVLVFFLEDSQNLLPLGPVEYNVNNKKYEALL
ncbi:hypothetical protein A2872_04310 [Candidatus Gottesmanbacteria bacterium RIFCSPHIGHO2_01_FULL_42_12]|uniref:Uncharacterized protein n=1 Tax=Candidatus Gottesmanbacteria bacterium RIFCSPHIGHO2_01_FULL_42_12 TaxID=1798377 RepID=A0A1F5Z1G2_9BACT|nr:MAG: hypothetical protein A2872_04310 [Candidatus Gottesmanbacteria bacterium RIFCSPHIGHO2_01_FULL_42_12]